MSVTVFASGPESAAARRIIAHQRANAALIQRFSSSADPVLAARTMRSLRQVYPWMSPAVSAQLGAYGVNPASREVAEIAGANLARRLSTGQTSTSRRRNVNEMRNVMAPIQHTPSYLRVQERAPAPMRTPGYLRVPEPGVTAEMLGLPTGSRQDYAEGVNIGPEELTPNLRRNLTQGDVVSRFPRLADEFAENRATFAAARQIESGGIDQFTQEQTQNLDQGGVVGGLGGTRGDPIDMSASENRSRNMFGPNVNVPQAQALADQLPIMDMTLAHLREGGATIGGIPVPGRGISAADLETIYTGPGRDEIEATLRQRQARLQQEHPDDPRIDGIDEALDFISGGRQSLGPDIAVAGVDFNTSDLWRVPWDAGRNTVRGAVMAMDSIWQYGQATFRQAVENPATLFNPLDDIGFTQTAVQQTDLGIVLENLVQGERVSTGSGFFVSQDSPVAVERRRRELRHGNIGGHVITMGRWAADRVPGVEPDDTAFNVLSGMVDAAWAVVDPGGAAVDTVARSAQFRRLLSAGGGYTATRTVRANEVANWLGSRNGKASLQYFADLDGADDIERAWQRSKQNMPEEYFRALAGGPTGDQAYVESMFRNVLGMGMETPGIPTARAAGTQPAAMWRGSIRDSPFDEIARLAQDAPTTGVQALDTRYSGQVLENLRGYMHAVRLDRPTIARVLDRVNREAITLPSRVRVQQLEREIETLRQAPASGLTLEGGTVVDRLADAEADLARHRAGLFIARPEVNRNILHEIVYQDMLPAVRDRLLYEGVAPGVARTKTTLPKTKARVTAQAPAGTEEAIADIAGRIDDMVIGDLQREGSYWPKLVGDNGQQAVVNNRVWPVTDGEHMTDLSGTSMAHWIAEHQSRYVQLPDDYRSVARMTRGPVHGWLTAPLSVSRTAEEGARQLRGYAALAETFMNKVWKPSRLLRPAFPIRVVGEEQFRIAAAGYDSAVSHPLSLFSIMAGRRYGRPLGETAWDELGEFTSTMNKNQRSWAIEFGGGSNGRYEPGTYYWNQAADGSREFRPGYHKAYTDKVAQGHSDDITRRVARILRGEDDGFDSIDELIAAGGDVVEHADDLRLGRPIPTPRRAEGGGQNIIARSRADLIDAGRPVTARSPRPGGYAARYDAGDAEIRDWDDYVESTVVRLNEMTGGNDDLLAAFAHGEIDGVRLNMPGSNRVNPKAIRKMRKYDEFLPRVIGGDEAHYDAAMGTRKAKSSESYDRALERAFALLASGPTDMVSRSPVFRQLYFRRVQELLPFADEATQARILRDAEKVSLVPERGFHLRMSAYMDELDSTVAPTMKTLNSAAARGKGDLTYDMVHEMASAAAMDNTRWLLYDVHKRGQFMDAMRMLFPFGEAWKEVITRWTSLTAARPGTVLTRAAQIHRAVGQPQDWEQVVRDPSSVGEIYENSHGETVFNYPGAEWFTGALSGVPIRLTGSLNGLTMVNSVIPGVSPIIQVPVAMSSAIRDDPKFKGALEVLFPYGLPDPPQSSAGAGLSLLVDQIFSPAVQRVFQGIGAGALDEPLDAAAEGIESAGAGRSTVRLGRPSHNPMWQFIKGVSSVLGGGPAEWDRLFLGSVFDVTRYRVSAGRGNTNSQGAINRLYDESFQDAAILTAVRGLAGLVLPSAPLPEMQIEDQSGSLLMLSALSADFQQMREEDYSTATARWLEKYGEDMALVMQAKTVPRTAVVPLTERADRWVQNHPGVQDDYPTTFGLWAEGNQDEDSFSMDAYTRYANDRTLLTLGRDLDVKDLIGLANDTVASAIYRRREDELLATPDALTEEGNLNDEAQQNLRDVHAYLSDGRYPGYGEDGLPDSTSTHDLQIIMGGPDSENTEIRRAVRDERFPAPLREVVGEYLARHDEFLTMLREHPSDWGDSTTYYESQSTRPLRDHLRYDVAPALRESLDPEYRPRWDTIWERLFDRVMTPTWAEEED